ncbi:MAG: (Na+)-NQR maturation NqrM [Planctomycetota bacterium]|nr:(Na+)-NQR maturation NqrM [Planctomycetota bacterium]
MTTFLSSLVVFALAITGMAIGVIVSNRRLKGTCGGLAGMTDSEGHSICESCITPATDCDRAGSRSAEADNAGAPFTA